jgi:hypothetical protein
VQARHSLHDSPEIHHEKGFEPVPVSYLFCVWNNPCLIHAHFLHMAFKTRQKFLQHESRCVFLQQKRNQLGESIRRLICSDEDSLETSVPKEQRKEENHVLKAIFCSFVRNHEIDVSVKFVFRTSDLAYTQIQKLMEVCQNFQDCVTEKWMLGKE